MQPLPQLGPQPLSQLGLRPVCAPHACVVCWCCGWHGVETSHSKGPGLQALLQQGRSVFLGPCGNAVCVCCVLQTSCLLCASCCCRHVNAVHLLLICCCIACTSSYSGGCKNIGCQPTACHSAAAHAQYTLKHEAEAYVTDLVSSYVSNLFCI